MWRVFAKKKPKKDGWYQCTVVIHRNHRYVMNLHWYANPVCYNQSSDKNSTYAKWDNGRFIDNIRQNVVDTYDVRGINGKPLIDIGQDRTAEVIAWRPIAKPYMKKLKNKHKVTSPTGEHCTKTSY